METTHAVSCWQCELSKEEAVPIQGRSCPGWSLCAVFTMQALRAFICLSILEFRNLQVFCARRDEHFLQRSAYSDNSCPCYPGGFFLLPCWPLLYQDASLWPGYFSFRPVWWSGFVTSLCCSKVAGKHRESGTLELLPGRVWLKVWGLFFSSHLGERLFMHEVSIWQSFHLKSSLFWECLSAPM